MRAVAVVSVCVLVACGRIGFDGIADGGAAGSDAVIDGGVFVGATATYVKASNTGADDAFGSAIAMSGDGQTLAITAYAEASSAGGVGANQNDNTAAGAGAVYVFVRIAGGWSQQAYIKAPDPDAGDTFGSSVALSRDGNLLAIGALGEDGSGLGVNPANDENRIDSGAAYLYRRSGTTWAFETYVKATNTGAGDAFGQAVALSGDGATLVVSAPGEDSNGRGVGASQTDNNASNAGAAYVYIQRQAGWAPVAYLKASNTSDGDQFGDAIAISDDGSTIAVGAYFEASGETGIDPSGADESSLGAGAVYVFAGTGDSWVQQAYVKAPNTDAGDQFGSSVALTANGSILVVGGTRRQRIAEQRRERGGRRIRARAQRRRVDTSRVPEGIEHGRRLQLRSALVDQRRWKSDRDRRDQRGERKCRRRR